MSEERELNDECPSCGHETIEEKRDYKGELLAVSVCPNCHTVDWMLPKDWDEEDRGVFDETKAWAEAEGIEMLKAKDLYYQITMSEPAQVLFRASQQTIRTLVQSMCSFLGSESAYIGLRGQGIFIRFVRVDQDRFSEVGNQVKEPSP